MTQAESLAVGMPYDRFFEILAARNMYRSPLGEEIRAELAQTVITAILAGQAKGRKVDLIERRTDHTGALVGLVIRWR